MFGVDSRWVKFEPSKFVSVPPKCKLTRHFGITRALGELTFQLLPLSGRSWDMPGQPQKQNQSIPDLLIQYLPLEIQAIPIIPSWCD